MKLVSKTDPKDEVDATQFFLVPKERPNPTGLMLFDNGWNIDGNNGRFIVKPGQWVLRRKGNIIEVVTTDELHARFKRDRSKEKIEVTVEFLEQIRDFLTKNQS
jgi:hypothetical protein